MFNFSISQIFGSSNKRDSDKGGGSTQEAIVHERQSQEQIVRPRSETVKKNISILVLGRSGSGKTTVSLFVASIATGNDAVAQFINAAVSAMRQSGERASVDKTAKIAETHVEKFGHEFKLVDTPGFDNPTIPNLNVFAGLVKYLLDNSRINEGITGIVYIHRAGDPLESRSLIQNMGVLSDIFLGENGFPRLTILVVPASSRHSASASIAQALPRPGSVFHAACVGHAKVLVSNLDQADVDHVLLSYESSDPVQLLIQHTSIQAPEINFLTLIEERLGYCENNTARFRLDQQAQHYQRQYKSTVNALEVSLQEAQANASQLSDAYQRTEEHVASQKDEILGLRRQLQQTQAEYASLRSQLQLQENIEQSDIVQSLKDLNRDIDDIGRSISEYLVDNYVQTVFGKDHLEVTALDALHLDDLKVLLGHTDENSSLIASSEGVGMISEDFFDYSIRFLLCRYLCQWVFGPFHPGVEPDQSKCISAMYDDVQLREPQAVSAKWRANCFKSIYHPEQPDITAQHIRTITQSFVENNLGPLITYFFGEQSNIMLEQQHLDRLQRLVQTAWDWNSTLKGEVIMLGDFYQTAYVPSSRFDPTLMNEFEPNSRKPPVETILGTLGLGLISLRAVGGGRQPETTVVCKALVATNSLYD